MRWHAKRAGLAGLVLLIALGVSACTSARHRSALAWPEDVPRPNPSMGSAGVWQAPSGELAAPVSLRLAQASGLADLTGRLTAGDSAQLLAEPSRLVFARDGLRALQERVGQRYVLIGELGTSRIGTSQEWVAILWFTPFVAVPFPFARREGVDQPAFALRVVDLETGRIEAEFFAMLSRKTARRGLSQDQLEAALRAMGLAEEAP